MEYELICRLNFHQSVKFTAILMFLIWPEFYHIPTEDKLMSNWMKRDSKLFLFPFVFISFDKENTPTKNTCCNMDSSLFTNTSRKEKLVVISFLILKLKWDNHLIRV